LPWDRHDDEYDEREVDEVEVFVIRPRASGEGGFVLFLGRRRMRFLFLEGSMDWNQNRRSGGGTATAPRPAAAPQTGGQQGGTKAAPKAGPKAEPKGPTELTKDQKRELLALLNGWRSSFAQQKLLLQQLQGVSPKGYSHVIECVFNQRARQVTIAQHIEAETKKGEQAAPAPETVDEIEQLES
jgi:hypothetical protein